MSWWWRIKVVEWSERVWYGNSEPKRCRKMKLERWRWNEREKEGVGKEEERLKEEYVLQCRVWLAGFEEPLDHKLWP